MFTVQGWRGGEERRRGEEKRRRGEEEEASMRQRQRRYHTGNLNHVRMNSWDNYNHHHQSDREAVCGIELCKRRQSDDEANHVEYVVRIVHDVPVRCRFDI